MIQGMSCMPMEALQCTLTSSIQMWGVLDWVIVLDIAILSAMNKLPLVVWVTRLQHSTLVLVQTIGRQRQRLLMRHSCIFHLLHMQEQGGFYCNPTLFLHLPPPLHAKASQRWLLLQLTIACSCECS